MILANKLFFAALLIFTVNACSIDASQNDVNILVADGARNIHRVNLGHTAVTQLDYEVDLQYPGMAISAEKLKALKQQGWRQCKQHKGQWEHFGDYAVEPRKLVHQHITSYAKKGEYMVVTMRYLSALPSKDPTESKPDNNTQRVYVIHYDLSVDEVRHQMGSNADTCLKGS